MTAKFEFNTGETSTTPVTVPPMSPQEKGLCQSHTSLSLSCVLPFLLTTGLRMDIKLVSLCHVCFHSSLQKWLSLDIKLVSLCHACFHSSLQMWLSLDIKLVSLCHACFPSSLQKWLSLDIKLVSMSCVIHLPKTKEA
jgi:hypothetical protein